MVLGVGMRDICGTAILCRIDFGVNQIQSSLQTKW